MENTEETTVELDVPKVLNTITIFKKQISIQTFKTIAIYIFLAVFLFVSLYYVVKIGLGETNSTLKDTNAKVEASQKVIDSIQNNQQFIVDRLFVVESSMLRFDQKFEDYNKALNKNTTELSKLKKIYNEKISASDTYSYSQLDSFFSNRYSTKNR